MTTQINLFGIQIDAVGMQQAVDRVLDWARGSGDGCKYVVTPNVDHAVLYQERADLRAAYRRAALVLADGFPLVVASRLLRRRLPERVAGSDLTPAVFSAAFAGMRVFLLGAAPGVADRAADEIRRRWPQVDVVGTCSPPLGFERNETQNQAILARIAEARPDVLLVGLGAPKQELWVHRHRDQIEAKVALCVGATIDFLAGHRRRAPHWMRTSGLEWLHRLASEPRRLVARYARDAWVFPQLLLRQWRAAA